MSTPGLPPTPAAEAVVYGIPNCDTVKKARSWLAEHGVAYRFHDFKKQGVPPTAWPAGSPPPAGTRC